MARQIYSFSNPKFFSAIFIHKTYNQSSQNNKILFLAVLLSYQMVLIQFVNLEDVMITSMKALCHQKIAE